MRVIQSHPARAFSSSVFGVSAQRHVCSVPVAPLLTRCSLFQNFSVTSGPHKRLVSNLKRTRLSLEGVGSPDDSDPNVCYEPNIADFSSYTDPEHNPIDIPDDNQDVGCSDDATMISGSARGMRDSEALSSSRQAAASVQSYKPAGNLSRSCVKSS